MLDRLKSMYEKNYWIIGIIVLVLLYWICGGGNYPQKITGRELEKSADDCRYSLDELRNGISELEPKIKRARDIVRGLQNEIDDCLKRGKEKNQKIEN